MKVLRFLGKALLFLLFLIFSMILTLFLLFLMTRLQEKLLLPENYLYWLMKSPFSYLFLIFEVEIIAVCTYYLFKDFWALLGFINRPLIPNQHRWKRRLIGALIFLNLLVFYLMFFNISVLSETGVTDYNALNPTGTFYSYESLHSITTGINGRKRKGFPFQGEFYYKVTLPDDKTIDFAEMGGTRTEEDYRFTLKGLDKKLTALDIPKTASTENLPYLYESLDPLYVEAIKEILSNIE